MYSLSSLGSSIALIVVTAMGYAVATAGMKMASLTLSSVAVVLIGLGFAVAILAEIWLLARADLAVVYIAVIATETVLIVCLALFIGDTITMKQIFGGVLAMGGILLTLDL